MQHFQGFFTNSKIISTPIDTISVWLFKKIVSIFCEVKVATIPRFLKPLTISTADPVERCSLSVCCCGYFKQNTDVKNNNKH